MLNIRRYALLALLVLGSATLLFSCADKTSTLEYDYETLMTERSENRTIMMMENGKRSYSFTAPIIEGYSLAQNPYQEFRKGIKMITYTSDSLSLEDATITANYAIYYDKQKLWEAKGDVVVVQTNGRKLYTQQLFWNQATHRIYSNVDSRIIDGDEVFDCEGFESDENMKDWRYRKLKAVTYFSESEVQPKDETSNTSADNSAAQKAEKPSSAKDSKSGDEAKKNQTHDRPRRKLNDSASLKISPKELDKNAMPMAKPTRDINM